MPFEGTCHFCKTALRLDRVGFRDLCSNCDRELHACVQCAHYAPGKPYDCNETGVEPVFDKEKNNRCEWFQFGDNAAGDGLSKSGADALLKQLLGESSGDG